MTNMTMKFSGQLLLPSYPKFPKHHQSFIKTSAFHPPVPNQRPVQLQSPNNSKKPFLLSEVLSCAIAVSLSISESPLPSLAIPFLNGSQTSQSSLLPPTTPFSQAKNLPTGLENGYLDLNFSNLLLLFKWISS